MSGDTVNESTLRQFREDIYEILQTYRQEVGNEQLLFELIGAVCAHVCTYQIVTGGRELDSLVEGFRMSLTLALKTTAEARLYHEQGIMVWPTKEAIDA